MNSIYKIANLAVLFSFLWSNIVWACPSKLEERSRAGGVECYKLSAPSQVAGLAHVADAFACGQQAVKQLIGAGIKTKEGFYRELGKGRTGELAGIPCLVFSDRDDPSELAYYVFNPNEPYFSRIATHPEVNDSFWEYIEMLGINNRTVPESIEFNLDGKRYFQKIYALTDKELELVNTGLKLAGGSVVSSRLGIKKEQPSEQIKILGDYTSTYLCDMVNWDEIRKAIERLKETHPSQWESLKRRTHDFEYFFFFDNLPSAAGIYNIGDDKHEEDRYVFALDSDLREILASGRLDQGALVDFYYLLLVHEGTELLFREGRQSCETISPDLETEVEAFIEKAKVYLSMSEARKVKLRGLLMRLDKNEPNREDRFMPVIEFVENIGKDELEKENGIDRVIDYILSHPDYAKLQIIDKGGIKDRIAIKTGAIPINLRLLFSFVDNSRSEKMLRQIKDLFKDSDWRIRQSAVYAYSKLAGEWVKGEAEQKEALRKIEGIFGDTEVDVQQSAIDAYSKLAEKWIKEEAKQREVLKEIKGMFVDSEFIVRQSAVDTYSRLAGEWIKEKAEQEEALGEIKGMFGDTEADVQEIAVVAYGRLAEKLVKEETEQKEVLRELRDICRGYRWEIQQGAIKSYIRLSGEWVNGEVEQVEILLEIGVVFLNSISDFRQGILEAYARLVDKWVKEEGLRKELLSKIKGMFGHHDRDIRREAVEVYYGSLADECVKEEAEQREVLGEIKGMFWDDDQCVRRIAVDAYSRLAEKWVKEKTWQKEVLGEIEGMIDRQRPLMPKGAYVSQSATEVYGRLAEKWVKGEAERKRVLREIKCMIKDSDRFVRQKAVESYSRLAEKWVNKEAEQKEVLGEIKGMFRDSDSDVRRIAIDAYSRLAEKWEWVKEEEEQVQLLREFKGMYVGTDGDLWRSALDACSRLLVSFGRDMLNRFMNGLLVTRIPVRDDFNEIAVVDEPTVIILARVIEIIEEKEGEYKENRSKPISPAYGTGRVLHKEEGGLNDTIRKAIDSGNAGIVYGNDADNRFNDKRGEFEILFNGLEDFVMTRLKPSTQIYDIAGSGVNILTIKTFDDIPGLFIRGPDDYAVAHFGHFGGKKWIYIDEDLFNKLLNEGAMDELYALILYELVKCYGENQETAESIERSLVGDRLRNKVQSFIEESIISSRLARQVISYYQAREGLVEALRRGDPDLYENAIRGCEKAAGQIKQMNYPIWQIQAVVRTIKKNKDVPLNKEFITDELEVTRVLEENFTEAENKDINEWIKEFLLSLGYDEETRDDLFRDISHIVYPMTLLNVLPRTIRGYEYFPQALQDMLKQLSRFVSIESSGLGGAVVRNPILEKDVTIQIPQTQLRGFFKAGLLHEIIHYLGFMNILPFDGANEMITQAIAMAVFLTEDRWDEYLLLLERSNGSKEEQEFILGLGRERYRQGMDVPQPERIKEIVENLISTRWQDYLHLGQDAYLDTVERFSGIYLAGYADEKARREGFDVYKYIVDYGKRYLPRKKNADFRRRINYRDRRYINGVLEELVPIAQVTIPDQRLSFTEKGINELRKCLDARWNYDGDGHKMHYVPWDIIEYGRDAGRGLTLQEVFRARYSEEGAIEDEYVDNSPFVLLFRVLETLRAVSHGISEFTGREEDINLFYRKKCRILDLDMEKERMAEKPRFIQYLEALFYMMVMTEDVNNPVYDPRVEDAEVKKAVSDTFREILSALAEDTAGFYEKVRDKIWPIAEKLLEEDRKKEEEEQARKKLINEMIENGEFEVGDTAGGKGLDIDWDDLSDKAKEKVKEKMQEYIDRMKEEAKKQIQEAAEASLQSKIDELAGEMQDVTGDPASTKKGQGGKSSAMDDFGSPLFPQMKEAEQGEGVEDLKRHVEELKGMLEDLKEQARDISDKAQKVKEQAGSVDSEAQTVKNEREIEKGKELEDLINKLIDGLKNMRAGASRLNEKAESAGEKVDEIAGRRGKEDIREDLISKIRDLMEEITALAQKISNDTAEGDKSANQAEISCKEIQEYLEKHPEWIDSIKGRADTIQKEIKEIEERLKTTEKNTKQIGEKADEVISTTEAIENGTETGGLIPPGRHRPEPQDDRPGGRQAVTMPAHPDVSELLQAYLEETADTERDTAQREERHKEAVRDFTHLSDSQRQEYNKIRETARRYERVLKKAIQDVLKQMEQDKWVHQRNKGQLDPQRLHLAKTKERKLFRRRVEPGKIKFRISLLIDISASMNNYGSSDKMTNAVKTALLFLEALRNITGIEFEVVGYGDGYKVYKGYKERLTHKKAYETIIGLKNREGVDSGDTKNRDAINGAIKRMRDIGDDDEGRIIIIISDGLSDEVKDIYDGNKDIVFIPYGIGSEAEAVAMTYAPYGKIVADIAELAKTIGRAILKQIRKVLPIILAVAGKALINYLSGDSNNPDDTFIYGIAATVFQAMVPPQKGVSFSKSFEIVKEGGISYLRLKGSPSLKWQRYNGGKRVPHDSYLLETPRNVDDIVEIIKQCNGQKYTRSPLLLLGEAGTAKNTKAYYAARLLNQNIRFMPLHSDISEDDLVVRRNFGETKTGETGWTKSELVRAMEDGEWIIMDEVNKVKPEVIAKLNQILQSRKIYLPDGTVVHARDGFAVIFTANPPVGPYKVNQLSGEFKNRCDVYEIGYLPANDEKLVLYDVLMKERRITDISQISKEEKDLINELVRAANDIRDMYFGRDPATGNNVGIAEMVTRPISTRSLVNIIRHIAKMPGDIKRVRSILRRYYCYEWEEDEVKARIEAVINNYASVKKDLAPAVDKNGPMIKKDRAGRKVLKYKDIEIPCADTAPDNVNDVPWDMKVVWTETNLKYLEDIMADIADNRHMLFIGEAGTGKDLIAEYICYLLYGASVEVYNVTQNTIADELIAYMGYGEKEDEKTCLLDGYIVRAMRAGRPVILDEVNKAKPEVLACLNNILQFGWVDLPDGERVYAENGFFVICTMNPLKSSYIGNKELSGEFLDRFSVHNFGSLPEGEEVEILMDFARFLAEETPLRFKFLKKELIKKLVEMTNKLRKLYNEDELPIPISMRNIKRVIVRLSEYPEDYFDRGKLDRIIQSSYHFDEKEHKDAVRKAMNDVKLGELKEIVTFRFNTGDNGIDQRLMTLKEEKNPKEILRLVIEIRNIAAGYHNSGSKSRIKTGLESGLEYVKKVNKDVKGDIVDIILNDIRNILEEKTASQIQLMPVITGRVPDGISDRIRRFVEPGLLDICESHTIFVCTAEIEENIREICIGASKLVLFKKEIIESGFDEGLQTALIEMVWKDNYLAAYLKKKYPALKEEDAGLLKDIVVNQIMDMLSGTQRNSIKRFIKQKSPRMSIDEILGKDLIELINRVYELEKRPRPVVWMQMPGLMEEMKKLIDAVEKYKGLMILILLSNNKSDTLRKEAGSLLEEDKQRGAVKGKSRGGSVVSSRLGIKKEQASGQIKMLGDYTSPDLWDMVNRDEIRQAVERLKETHPSQWKSLKRRTHDFEYFFFYDNLPSAAGIYNIGDDKPEEDRYVFALDSDLREILANGNLDKDALVDFYYLLLVHEGTELLLREGRQSCETISPDLETEVEAFIEKAKAYLGLPDERKAKLKGLLVQLDANEPNREDRFMPVVEFIETLQLGELETEEGIRKVIDFILTNPDYKGQGMDDILLAKLLEKAVKISKEILERQNTGDFFYFPEDAERLGDFMPIGYTSAVIDRLELDDLNTLTIRIAHTIVVRQTGGERVNVAGWHSMRSNRIFGERIVGFMPENKKIILESGEVISLDIEFHEGYYEVVAIRRSRVKKGKSSPLAKQSKGQHAELLQFEIMDGKPTIRTDFPVMKEYLKYPMVNRNLLGIVFDRLISKYGLGILAVVDAIRIVDNIRPDIDTSPYGMMVKEDGKNILLLDVDTFDNEELLYIVLEHELKESIMTVIPYQDEAVRELTTNFMSLKLALEKGIKIDKAQLERLGADLQFFEALEVLQALENVRDDDIIAVAIEHMRNMPYYKELFEQFSFTGEWKNRVKDAEDRYKVALQVFNEILGAKDAGEKVKETEGVAITVIKTFTGLRVEGLDKISHTLAKMIGVLAKQVDGSEKLAGKLTRSESKKYILASGERLKELQTAMGEDKYEQVETQLAENNYFICTNLSEGTAPADAIRLVDPGDLENTMQVAGMLYLPMLYTRSALFMSALVLQAGGDLSKIPLVKAFLKELYTELSDDDLMILVKEPWQILPKIQPVIQDIENLRKAVAIIEKAA